MFITDEHGILNMFRCFINYKALCKLICDGLDQVTWLSIASKMGRLNIRKLNFANLVSLQPFMLASCLALTTYMIISWLILMSHRNIKLGHKFTGTCAVFAWHMFQSKNYLKFLYGVYFEMPQKACERWFCHVIAFAIFFEMPKNRTISFSVLFLL